MSHNKTVAQLLEKIEHYDKVSNGADETRLISLPPQ
jgi:hypothetical protein